MTQHFTASDGARIAFTSQGEGPVLLLLSGLTRNGTDFTYVLPHLRGVRAITMDYRGRGQSDWSGPETYTVPREAQDVIELMAHLGIEKAAILGTSRGGLIAMTMALMARDRLTGVLFNDIGPEIMTEGLNDIGLYVGRNPPQKTLAEAEAVLSTRLPGFANVPEGRWAEEARRHYIETPEGLKINYDPDLRIPVMATFEAEAPDLWPVFDALAGLPLAGLRGANSNLLSAETFAEMQRRRPDMIAATVPDRGHVPFLDEPESLAVIGEFIGRLK